MERPILEVAPEWMQEYPEKIHLSSINALYLRLPGDDHVSFYDAAVTSTGIINFPEAFLTPTSLRAFTDQLYMDGKDFLESPYLAIPDRYPETLLKWDYSIRQSVKTLMTLALFQRSIPHKGNGYTFRPTTLYWAITDQKYFDYLFMERAPVVKIPRVTKTYDAYIDGVVELKAEAKKLPIHLSIGGNDHMYLGRDPSGKPTITVVDQCDDSILEFLQNPGLKESREVSYWKSLG